MNSGILYNITGWFFGMLFSFIGAVNTFWGNDPFFGLFILAVSLIYYPPFHRYAKKAFSINIPAIIKILLALFLIWASVGVGELFDKIEMMLRDLK
ncbi:MAG: hypothetical protein FJZ78_11565 [Bacteroidetes bacterium]|nr:hypothetical protein [Bacteroidota bacterium]